VAHALGFAAAAEAFGGGADGFLDLGSGGGLPGLVLAARWGESPGWLLDSNQRRAEALGRAVEELGWAERIQVLCRRAEEAGRHPSLRGTQALVVARSFGPPAVVAECAAPLLRPGGLLVVSEPPPPGPEASSPTRADAKAEPGRWPAAPLADFGLEPVGEWRGEFGYQVLSQVRACPDRYPRRPGIPAKRPHFG
jgi:16S rRNA (guanine527-N7)-methyltransferase